MSVSTVQRAPVGWIDSLTRGVAETVGASTRSVLNHYLGTSAVPAPFAGRDGALRALRAAIGAPDGPRLTIFDAETGRGKTALLCHLVEQVARDGGATTVFHPFSERFLTDRAEVALDALLGRLRWLHGMPPLRHETPAEKRALLAAFLRKPLPDGRPLLFVLDGLDEAADLELTPGLIPLDLPATTRVVLSVRRTPQLDGRRLCEALGWPVSAAAFPELPKLQRSDVATLLERHLPDAAAHTDALFQLSRQGDPLLVRLLLDEWGAYGVDLAGPSQAGLRGLWARQRRRAEADALEPGGMARPLLAALAVALEPLDFGLLPKLLADELADVRALRRALRAIGRFILEPEPQVYAFCHPALKQYVEEFELTDDERRAWRARFADWAIDRVDAAQVASERPVPGYVARRLVQHLRLVTPAEGVSEHRLQQWRILLTPGWWTARARSDANGGASSYLADLDTLREVLVADDRQAIARGIMPQHLGDLTRCALSMASTRSRALIDPALVEVAVMAGRLDYREALTLLRESPEPEPGTSKDRPIDWRAFVADAPAELLGELIGCAVRLARSLRRVDPGLALAVSTRVEEWLPRCGVGWLDELDVKARIDCLGRAAIALDTASTSADKLRLLIERSWSLTHPSMRRWWAPHLRAASPLIGPDVARDWARELLEVPSDAALTKASLTSAIHAAGVLDEVEARAFYSDLVAALTSTGPALRWQALVAIDSVAPTHLTDVIRALDRAGVLVDACEPIWVDPVSTGTTFEKRRSQREAAQRCHRVRAALDGDMVARALARAVEKLDIMAADEERIVALRRLAPHRSPVEVEASCADLHDAEAMDKARRWLAPWRPAEEQTRTLMRVLSALTGGSAPMALRPDGEAFDAWDWAVEIVAALRQRDSAVGELERAWSTLEGAFDDLACREVDGASFLAALLASPLLSGIPAASDRGLCRPPIVRAWPLLGALYDALPKAARVWAVVELARGVTHVDFAATLVPLESVLPIDARRILAGSGEAPHLAEQAPASNR